MHSPSVCPDFRDFQRLVSGQLSVAAGESLLRHLEECTSCLEKIQTLPRQDGLAAWIRQDPTLTNLSDDQRLAPLMQRLMQLCKASAAPAESNSIPPSRGSAGVIGFSCSGCGKSLRAREELAGKKVKCPRCAQVSLVPTSASKSTLGETHSTAGDTGRFVPADPNATQDIRPSKPSVTATGMPSSAAGTDQSLESTRVRADSRQQKVCGFLAAAQAADELGRLGPYRVLQVLGAGGMGVVFRAEDPQLQRLVALKAMLPELAENESARQRFLREARAAARIKHDHIVSIYQVGEDRGAPFLAMELLQGESLEDRIKREGKLPLAEVLRIGREMAEGLQSAHEQGLIHRDIKPGNVWLEGQRGRVKILDFGLARSSADDVHLTQSGAIVGTPAYMPPEQARGESVDARSDLYSLGCVLYRLCTGVLPFKGDNAMSLLLALAIEKPRSVREIDPDVPAPLAELIQRLLAKQPAERLSTATEVAQALEAIAASESASVRAAAAPALPRRRRRLAVAAAVGVLLLAGVLAMIVIVRNKQGDEIARLNVPEGGSVVIKDEEGGQNPSKGQVDRKDQEAAKVPPPAQIPEPPPLEEWLTGHKLLTVAQDGKGQFRTIQAALNALKPHQVVKVLDRGPYYERLELRNVPQDSGLISEVNTVVELRAMQRDHGYREGGRDYYKGHLFDDTDGFRLSGFHFILPSVDDLVKLPGGFIGMGIRANRPGGFVFENCKIHEPPSSLYYSSLFIGFFETSSTKPACVRRCLIEGKLAVGSGNKDGSASVLINQNYLKSSGKGFYHLMINGPGDYGTVAIHHNILAGPLTQEGSLYMPEINQVKTLDVYNNTLFSSGASVPILVGMPPRGAVHFQNNLSLRPGFLVFNYDIKEQQVEGPFHSWHVGHNSYTRLLARDEESRVQLPHAPSDVLGRTELLSHDPEQADYLHIPVDSPLARGGAGGAWPSYIGALPPGPAPREGDWLTRLRQPGGNLAPASKTPPTASPLDALDPAQIPAAERFSWQPRELVAVVGEHRQRHWRELEDLAVSLDGTTVATTGQDGHVRFWDAATLKPRGTSEYQEAGGIALYVPAGPRKGLVWWAAPHPYNRLRLIDPGTGRLDPAGADWVIQVPGPREASVTRLAVSSDGSLLTWAGWFPAVHVWDVGGDRPRASVELKTAGESPIAFAPGSNVLAYCPSPKEVRLIDPSKPDMREVARLPHEQVVASLAFARNGQRLAAGGDRGLVTLWELVDREWKRRAVFKASTPALVDHLDFSHSGKLLAVSGHYSFAPEVWEVESAEPRFRLRLGFADLRARFAEDDRCLITTYAHLVRRWKLGEQGAVEEPAIPLERALAAASLFEDRMLASGDGRRLASMTLDGKVRLWDMSGPRFREYPLAPAAAGAAWPIQGWLGSLSPDGNLLATYQTDPPFTRLWDVSRDQPQPSDRYKATVNQIVAAWSTDGQRAYAIDAGQQDAGLHVLDGSGPVLHRVASVETGLDTRGAGPARFRVGGSMLAFKRKGAFDGFEVWDVGEEKPRRRAILHKGDLCLDVAVSPDGKRLACAIHNNNNNAGITLWDLTAQEPRRMEKLDVSFPVSVCYMPDSQRLVWSDLHGRLVLWNPAIQAPEREWKLPGVMGQVFVPRDGRHLITYNGNGTIYVLRPGPR